MDKRYQVFVSSTFDDLREERAAVISSLLQLDCFPAGMELFPAADDDSWTLIKSVIDDSDYYLVSSPESLRADRMEQSKDGRRGLDEFRRAVQTKNCRHWADRGELVSAVMMGIQHLKKTRPGTGWVQSSEMGDASLKDEVLGLRRQIDSLNEELRVARSQSTPLDTNELAQGSQETSVLIDFYSSDAEQGGEVVSLDTSLAWDELIRAILPQTFGAGADLTNVMSTLTSLAREKASQRGLSTGMNLAVAKQEIVSRSSVFKVLNQMVALELIEARVDSTTGRTAWFATAYGAKAGARLVAERRSLAG